MRVIRHLAAAAASAGLLLAPAAGVASAATAHPAAPAAAVRLTGGMTTVTTGPGIAQALLGHGIVPIATAPGSESLHGTAVALSFPVTGGQVSLKPLGGCIDHQGGILFLNLTNGKAIQVSTFVISLTHADLTGIVNGNPKMRVPVFTLSLAHAQLHVGPHTVTATGIGLSLTRTAASALDAALGTTLFTPGLAVGTAATMLRF
jgi:hypothetical protein